MKMAIIWGSTTGNTENAAQLLREQLGDRVSLMTDVDEIETERMLEYDVVLLGVSTWDFGELQQDWHGPIEDIGSYDWSNIKVGFFGCGDADGYPDSFADAFRVLWDEIEPKGATLIGKWPTDGYLSQHSRAVCDDGKFFLGLPLDEESQPDLSPGRIEKWAEQLCRELEAFAAAA